MADPHRHRDTATQAPVPGRDVRPVFSCDIFARQAVGGVSRYFSELHRELRATGVKSLVLAPLYVTSNLESEDGIIGWRMPERLRVRGADRLAIRVGHATQRPSLRWLSRHDGQTVFHPSYYGAAPVASDLPIAVTVYDMIHERFSERLPNANRLTEQKRRWVDAADVVLAISASTKRELVELFDVDPERVVVTYLAATKVEPDETTMDRLGQQSFLLYVGQRQGYKNFDGFVSAFSRSQAAAEGVRLIAFGGGPPTAREREHIERFGLLGSVDFVSGDDRALAAHYVRALGLVYPSLAEGFGLPPVEAMLYGCPVAAANAPAIAEVVGNAALLFSASDDEGMTRSIDQLVSDDACRARLCASGRDRALKFNWADTARVTLEAYSRAVVTAGTRR